jgi:transposase
MQDRQLLQMALALAPPWTVARATFDAAAKRLDIHLDFSKGSRFACPQCEAAACQVHDTEDKTWRHLNFFQHEAYLHARVPRVNCSACGVRQVSVPWARDGSGFTLLFEALAMTMMTSMPVAAVARLLGEHDTRLWRVLHHYVEQARARADHAAVTRVAFDETAARRGHDYVSLFVDLDGPRVLFVADGKDARTVEAFAADLTEHGGAASNVTEVCIDMSPAFIKGAAAHLPGAHITFDKFHAVKIINDAVDKVRRAEQKNRPELKKTRYIWLKNKSNLKQAQLEALGGLTDLNLKTARAYQIRLTFQDLYAQPSREAAEAFLKKWYFWTTHSRMSPMIDAARTIKRHWDGILRWFDSKIANGILEGINSLVQAAKAKARGYRSSRNLKAIIYLIAGKLDVRLPT